MAAVEDVVQLQFLSTCQGQQVSNSFHLRRNPTAGDWSAALLAALLADSNTTALITAYRAMMHTTYTLDELVARQVHDPTDPGAQRDIAARPLNLAGTRAMSGDDAPSFLTLVMNLHSDLSGRRYRGRVFIPPPAKLNAIAGQGWKTDENYWTNAAAFITELTKTMYTSGGSHYAGEWNDVDLCIWSPTARVTSGQYYARVVDAVRQLQVRSIRSRRPTT